MIDLMNTAVSKTPFLPLRANYLDGSSSTDFQNNKG